MGKKPTGEPKWEPPGTLDYTTVLSHLQSLVEQYVAEWDRIEDEFGRGPMQDPEHWPIQSMEELIVYVSRLCKRAGGSGEYLGTNQPRTDGVPRYVSPEELVTELGRNDRKLRDPYINEHVLINGQIVSKQSAIDDRGDLYWVRVDSGAVVLAIRGDINIITKEKET